VRAVFRIDPMHARPVRCLIFDACVHCNLCSNHFARINLRL
jgi:hypothetical protein